MNFILHKIIIQNPKMIRLLDADELFRILYFVEYVISSNPYFGANSDNPLLSTGSVYLKTLICLYITSKYIVLSQKSLLLY